LTVLHYGEGVTVIVVPYHQDERLADDLMPLPERGDYLVLEPDLPDGALWFRLGALADAIASQVALAVSEGGSPVTVLSGDCLVALGTLAGVQRAGSEPALIWLDAHGDVHTLETTTSGYLGGLSLRLALGAHPELIADPLGLRFVPEDRAILVGARDLDPPEEAFLAGSAVRRCTVAELTAEVVPEGALVLHVDLDVIDPGELPGLLFPAPGGPPAADVVAAVRRVLATGRVAALDLACTWRPSDDGRVRKARADLLAALLA
jgi:arginase